MAIDPKTLREAQLIMLEMLVEFDAVCKQHALTYWLDSGTLLGAVRHKGFIPWDDDIDIAMPLEDYRALARLPKEVFSDTIFFQTKKTDPKFPFDYMKLRSNKATIIEFHEQNKTADYHQGVFVDIFPMLSVKKSPFHQWYYKSSLALIRFFSHKNLHVRTSIPNDTLRSLLSWTLQKMHQQESPQHTQLIYGGEMPDVAAWFDAKEVFPLAKIRFEDAEFYAPKNAHHYLSAIYSFDYMQLPPEDKRTIHAHDVIIHTR
ncbi:MAG TPA: LicD family protein [Sulfuricurvum sp.]|nr:LicD family protein [Sulfuricurvum sp.]